MAEAGSNQPGQQAVLALTTEIVGAYATCHTVVVSDLLALIATVGRQLPELGQKPVETKE